MYVVDASVAAKWTVGEIHSAHAARLLSGGHTLLAPDLLLPELANVLVKKLRRREVSHEASVRALDRVARLLRFEACAALTNDAFAVALQYGRTVYDALYVVMAVRESSQLVTADRRLFDAVAPGLPDNMLWIEDVPPA